MVSRGQGGQHHICGSDCTARVPAQGMNEVVVVFGVGPFLGTTVLWCDATHRGLGIPSVPNAPCAL